jgi:hypothetical protein
MNKSEYGYTCEVCNNKEHSLLVSKDMSNGRNICCVCYHKEKDPSYPYSKK